MSLKIKNGKKMAKNLMQWLHNPLPLKPIYYVLGEENFLISEIKKTFVKHVHQDQGLVDFNQDNLDAKQLDVGKLISALETLPVMSKHRLVFCSNMDSFKESDWEKLDSFLEKPVNTTIFVCFFQKIDRRKRFFKKLQTKAEELPAKLLREWEVSPWVDFMSKKLDLKFSTASKSLFCQLVGANLMDVYSEMNKLKNYKGESQQVSEKDLIAIISQTKIDSIFDLTDAIGKKDMVASLACLARLLENNQNEVGALALVARHIRILAQFQEGAKRNLSKPQIIVMSGVSPYFFQNYLQQSQLWTEAQIQKIIEILFETDKALKSSPLSSHIWLENFILEACTPL